jgi:Ca2+-binding RTX toxin-like protein
LGSDVINAGLGDDLINTGLGSADSVNAGAGNDTIVMAYRPFGFGDTLPLLIDGGDGSDTIYDDRQLVNGFSSANFQNIETYIAGPNNWNITLKTAGELDKFQAIGGFRQISNTLGLGGVTDLSAKTFVDNSFYWYNGSAYNDTFILPASYAVDVYMDGSLGNNTLISGAGNDYIYSGYGNDYVKPGAGNDFIDGQDGVDTIDLSNATSSLTVVLDLTILPNPGLVIVTTGGIGTKTIKNVENVFGGDFGNILTGSIGANVLIGGAGNDTLNGGAGADTLRGGTGDDTYVVDNALDNVIEYYDSGNDTLNSSVNFVLTSSNFIETVNLTGVGNTSIAGNELNNILNGNSGNNALSGAAGNDTIDGGVGADTLSGGLGNDLFIIDNLGDIVIENASEGTDTVKSSVSYIIGANIENATLTGDNTNDGVLGNALANVINGNGGNNGIASGDANDSINAGAGNDVLDGGLGADALNGGLGADVYFIDNAGDTVVGETAEVGVYDTVWTTVSFTLPSEVEILILNGGTLAINGTGNAGAGGVNPNLMLGNNAVNVLTTLGGDDIILGLDGNDTISAGGSSVGGYNLIVGGNGNDVMTSGTGHDFFAYTNISEAGDTINGFTASAGNALDILDLRTMFTTFTNWSGSGAAAAVADGHLTCTQLGGNTLVYADANGGVHDAGEQILLVTLIGTTAAAVQGNTLV